MAAAASHVPVVTMIYWVCRHFFKVILIIKTRIHRLPILHSEPRSFRPRFHFLLGKRSVLHKKNSVDASVVFWVVCDLGIFTPDYFAAGRHKTKLANVDFNNSTFRDDSKLSVERGVGVLFHSNYRQAKGCFEFWMCHVCLLRSKSHGPNKPFIFRGLCG